MRLRGAILTLILSLVVVSLLNAQTDQIAKQESVVASLKKQIADGEREIESLRKSRATSEVQMKAWVAQIETRNRLLEAQRKEESIIRAEISSADYTSSQLSAQIEQERSHYARMVREAYRSYQSHSVLTYLFTARDFQDVARKIANLRAVAELRERRIDRIDSLSTQLSRQREVLVDRKGELEAVVRDLTQQKSRLESDVKSARQNISAMSAKERKVLQQSELQQRQLDAAIKELQKLIIGNQAGASFSGKLKGLALPVVGGRVKQYKENMAEIVGAVGAKVTAIYEGRVVDVRSNRITGKYDIYLAHGEYITSYAGLSSVSVTKDQMVTRNAVIGVIGEAVDIITMQSEHKIVFGVYPPTTKETITVSNFFKK